MSTPSEEQDELRAALVDLADEYERLIDRCPPEVAVLHLPLIRARAALREQT